MKRPKAVWEFPPKFSIQKNSITGKYRVLRYLGNAELEVVSGEFRYLTDAKDFIKELEIKDKIDAAWEMVKGEEL